MNTHTVTPAELEARLRRGIRWLAVAAYPYGDRQEGDILSFHRTPEAVIRRYRFNPRVKARSLRVALFAAQAREVQS